MLDDQPCHIATANKSVVSVPYSIDTNNFPIFALQNQTSNAIFKRTLYQFDHLYVESETITRVMAISVRPYQSCVPHRIGYLEQTYEHIQARPDALLWT